MAPSAQGATTSTSWAKMASDGDRRGLELVAHPLDAPLGAHPRPGSASRLRRRAAGTGDSRPRRRPGRRRFNPVQIRTSQPELHGCLDAQVYAERGLRRGSPPACPGRGRCRRRISSAARRFPCPPWRADIFSRHILPADGVDQPAEGFEQCGSLVALRIADDHRLAAAEPQVGHGILVAHAAREPAGHR